MRWVSGWRLVFVATIFLVNLNFPIFQSIYTQSNMVDALEWSRFSTPERIEQARQQGLISQETAYLYLAYALSNPEELPGEFRSDVPWDGTLSLLQLRSDLQEMPSNNATTEAIQKTLSSICSYSDEDLPESVLGEHFYVEYESITGGLVLVDYLVALEAAWENQVDQFGWAAPPVFTLNPPPGRRYPVHITTLSLGLYGFVSSDGDYAGFVGDNPSTSWNEGDAYASCMVLNRDYSIFPGTPQAALNATIAHEFNHAIQYGLGALNGPNLPDPVFIEGGATWIEDETFDEANDNYNYLWPFFNSCMGNYNYSPYPYWITFRGMLEPFGTGIRSGSEDIMQAFWELTSQNLASNLGAMNRALEQRGTSLADVYHNYAIAVKFNRPCQGDYVRPYCLEEGPDYVNAAGPTFVHGTVSSVGGYYAGNVQDNFALNWVRLPENTGSYDVTLRNTSAGGALRGSVVCDTGTSLRVQSFVYIVEAGGAATLADINSSNCSSVVMVITNQAVTGDNPQSCLVRSYQSITTRRVAPTPTPVSVQYFPFAHH